MVYEFDAADLLQPVMYPAIAKSFKTAGFQWATQFAYDPMSTAYGNTEYQTHYLNLAYTPSKAISLLIAAKVFHRLPRGKQYESYPADSLFDVFRISYRNQLSKMNSGEEFYYSNTTATSPSNLPKLRHLAGVGSSPVVKYEGTGAYFLDRLEEGLWRLEVMPDALSIRDPFERASPKKEVTRIQWRSNRMQLTLPELGTAFSIKALNTGNSFSPIVEGDQFLVRPGTYLVTRSGKDAAQWRAATPAGQWQAGEFVAPQPYENTPQLLYTPVAQAQAGKALQIRLQAAGLDSSDKIMLQAGAGGRGAPRRIAFTRTAAYEYTAEMPSEMMTPGIVSYRILLQKGQDFYSYPGNYKGNPLDWDYYHDQSYELRCVPEGAVLTLFDAASQRNVLVYSSARRGGESRLVPAGTADGLAYRIAASEPGGDHVLGMQVYVGDRLSGLNRDLSGFRAVVVRARTTGPQSVQARLALISKDGAAFAAPVTLTSSFQDIEIPLSSLQRDSMLLLPRPYPGFMPLWFKAAGQQSFALPDVEKIQVTAGQNILPADLNKPYSMEVEAVLLQK